MNPEETPKETPQTPPPQQEPEKPSKSRPVKVYLIALFCAAVLAGSILCLQLPAYWYALGVFAGSVLGFSFAYFRVRWVERHLDEHIFCRGSLLQEKREPMPSAAVYTWLSQEEDAHEA